MRIWPAVPLIGGMGTARAGLEKSVDGQVYDHVLEIIWQRGAKVVLRVPLQNLMHRARLINSSLCTPASMGT